METTTNPNIQTLPSVGFTKKTTLHHHRRRHRRRRRRRRDCHDYLRVPNVCP